MGRILSVMSSPRRGTSSASYRIPRCGDAGVAAASVPEPEPEPWDEPRGLTFVEKKRGPRSAEAAAKRKAKRNARCAPTLSQTLDPRSLLLSLTMRQDAGARCARRNDGLYVRDAARAKMAKDAEVGAQSSARAKAELEERSVVMARELSELKAKQAELTHAQVELRKNQAAALSMYLTGMRKCAHGDARRRAGGPVAS